MFQYQHPNVPWVYKIEWNSIFWCKKGNLILQPFTIFHRIFMKLLLSALHYSQLTLARLHQKVGTYTRCAFHCAINIILVMMMPSSGLFVGNTRVKPHRTRYYSLWQDSEAGARRGIISMINFLVIFCKMEFSLHIKYWCPESSTAGRWGSLHQYILQHSDHQHQHTCLQPLVSRNYEGIEKNHA